MSSLPAASINAQQFSSPPPPRQSTDSPDPHRRRVSFKRNDDTPLEATTASWTSSIAHHCKSGRLSKALLQFTRMRSYGVEPNHITFVTLFSGFARSPSQGSSIGPCLHGLARKIGVDAGDVMVGTSVVDMYSKFGQMGSARLSFDHMGVKNKVTWNTIINGYMRNGEFQEAINLFDEMPERDAVSWTVLIDGFVKKGRHEEALGWFQQMQMLGMAPDFVTIISVISAVANLGILGVGLWLHRFVLKHDFRDNIRVNNSLIDMYCRCGCVELACQVFREMPIRNIVSWNSIIVGLAYNSDADEALHYFHSMQKEGFNADGVSFTGALNACSHAGLVEKGLELFESMVKIHKITPRIEHYGCMVDLYGRAGRIKEALQVLDKMPMKPNEVMIGSLLAACRDCKDVGLAERLMEYVHKLDPSGDSNHVLLSNIYASKGSWEGAGNVRKRMKGLGVQKRPGISSVEVNGAVHEFLAGDKSHCYAESVYTILEHLSHELKYDPSEGMFPESCSFEIY